MLNIKLKFSLILICIFTIGEISCHSQYNKMPMNRQTANKVREPAFAGQFYPARESQLNEELRLLYTQASVKTERGNIRALIVPHAGYVFSGLTAANGFIQLDPEADYKNIFIIASSHTTSFDGAAIYAGGDYKTPLGVVTVNKELAKSISESSPCFKQRDDAHNNEHSIEVQLPFLQYHLKKPFQIIPVVIGTNRPATCRQIADVLSPFMTDSALFIISTDFSHYPSYSDAIVSDKIIADAITSGSPDLFLEAYRSQNSKDIPGLVTPICSWTAVLTFMYIAEGHSVMEYIPLMYQNSGDAPLYGDKSRVVGYFSIAVQHDSSKTSEVKSELNLTEEEKSKLVEIARFSLNEYLVNGRIAKVEESGLSVNLKQYAGAFVTLNKNGKLRGCVGRFDPQMPLYQVVIEMAVSAAIHDTRFPKVEKSELDQIEIEISVLTPLKKVSSVEDIMLGRDGIYIRKGHNTGTLLPQVAAAHPKWTVEDFLGYCARDKAGLEWNGWKDAEIFTYQAVIFHETDRK